MLKREAISLVESFHKYYVSTLKRGHVLNINYLNKLLSKNTQHEHKKFSNLVQIITKPLPVIVYRLVYRHQRGYFFQISGGIFPNLKNPVYNITNLSFQNKAKTKSNIKNKNKQTNKTPTLITPPSIDQESVIEFTRTFEQLKDEEYPIYEYTIAGSDVTLNSTEFSS